MFILSILPFLAPFSNRKGEGGGPEMLQVCCLGRRSSNSLQRFDGDWGRPARTSLIQHDHGKILAGFAQPAGALGGAGGFRARTTLTVRAFAWGCQARSVTISLLISVHFPRGEESKITYGQLGASPSGRGGKGKLRRVLLRGRAADRNTESPSWI
jgi:hypothetical protein